MRLLLCFFLVVPLLAKPTDDHTTKEPSGEDTAKNSTKETGNATKKDQERERVAKELFALNREERALLIGNAVDGDSDDFSKVTELMIAYSVRGYLFRLSFTSSFENTTTTEYDNLAKEIVGMGQKIRGIMIKAMALDREEDLSDIHGWMILALPDSELKVAIEQLKLSMALTEEKQLEEIKKKSPELHRKLVAYNEVARNEINNLSEEPRRFMTKKNEALYTSKKSKERLEYVEAMYYALHESNDLTPAEKAEIASLPSKIGKTLKETLKKMFPSGPHAQADY